MIFFEIEKLLVKNKGLIVIIILLILKVALTISIGYDSEYEINLNPEGYFYYLDQFEGKITPDKQKTIEEEYNAVSHATWELEELSRQWQEGKINKEQYENLSIKNYEREKNREVFNLLYNQYIYAKDTPNERYILDVRGWNSLLSQNSPDLLLILCIVLVVTPLFCHEYENAMDLLILSSKKGKYNSAIVKLLCSLFIVVITTALFSLSEYFCFKGMVGLNNGNFPLKSLEFFKDSEYNISLNEAFVGIVSNRILGALVLTAIVTTIEVVSKKTIITLFASCSLAVIPYVLFDGKSTLYFLPFPSGLLIGNGYLRGATYSSYYSNNGTIEKIIQFQNIDKHIYIYILIGYFIEIFLLLFYCIKQFSGFIIINKQKKVIKLFSILAIICISLTGCTMKHNKNDIFTYNYEGVQNYGEANGYAISLDVERSIISAKRIETGEKILLTRNPFDTNYIINAIFVRDNWCYYLETERGQEGIRIYGIDLNSFSEKLIYNSIGENSEDFFGIMWKKPNINNSFIDYNPVSCFFINDQYIYYKRYSTLISIERKSSNIRTIAKGIDRGLSCSYYNGDIYFLDNQHRLNHYKEDEDVVYPINTVYTYKFQIKGKYISYNNMLDNNKTCYYEIN